MKWLRKILRLMGEVLRPQRSHARSGIDELDKLSANRAPHGEEAENLRLGAPASSSPQCGIDLAKEIVNGRGGHAPSAQAKLGSAQAALDAISRSWWAAAAERRGHLRDIGPEELAHEFWRYLRTTEDLLHFGVTSKWVKDQYSIFCKAAGVARAPPYRVFAHELAQIMPRRRREIWRGGRRLATHTAYQIVPFNEAMRRLEPVRKSA
jgi:hypothetical protein